MKSMRDRTKEDNDLPMAAAGSLFPYRISWLWCKDQEKLK